MRPLATCQYDELLTDLTVLDSQVGVTHGIGQLASSWINLESRIVALDVSATIAHD